MYVNIDEAETFGVESSAEARFDMFKPYANVSWVRRKFETAEQETYDTGIPAVTSRVGLELEKEFSSQLSGWSDFYVRASSDSDELDGDELEHKAGWATLNLAFGLELGSKRQYRVIVDLFNLGDNSYTTATENIPARGRGAVFKLVAEI